MPTFLSSLLGLVYYSTHHSFLNFCGSQKSAATKLTALGSWLEDIKVFALTFCLQNSLICTWFLEKLSYVMCKWKYKSCILFTIEFENNFTHRMCRRFEYLIFVYGYCLMGMKIPKHPFDIWCPKYLWHFRRTGDKKTKKIISAISYLKYHSYTNCSCNSPVHLAKNVLNTV